ncbi:PSD1 and planctomycete cytochrome C domain-containing protein [Verrucomicrobium sp. BvORR106]|uniref:PSD1 and planctomycete cytochrome C domain-containing protein n=1 Tax=Verrucomicrobium sp. BvORR106 TaxID=1403819 RepID=UPI00068E42D3|nr:PSD1 and planctomycete cytochrome C domain-containing protein [Verrucomicrobium sp. BvORR106]
MMAFQMPSLVTTLLVASSAALLAAGDVPARRISFNRDIRPILSDNCFACHGFDAKHRKAGLRLDVVEGARQPNDDGQVAIKPGDLASSIAWQRIITTDADDLMPPPDSHKTLKPEQRELIRRWIEEGGEYELHWSFIAPSLPKVPGIPAAQTAVPVGALDAFVQARLAAEGLKPSLGTDRETLIRRVTFDLTGLPPTPMEVGAFLQDATPQAYDRVVDRLLHSTAYGEQMARYWLDLARYADTHGLHLDNERSMWPYRDWVVRAFNENLPFDEFTEWQLAGDLIPQASRDQEIASGFNRCNVTTSEGGSINEEFIFRYAVDRASTAVEVWMGLTAGCAVCHDHKFDPISQKEFYSLYAFFNSAADPAMDGNILLTPPVLKLTSAEQARQLKEYDEKIAALSARATSILAQMPYTDPATVQPRPPVQESETVWVEDDFPAGAAAQHAGQHPLQWIADAAGKIFSGKRVIMRKDTGLAQDFFSGVKDPFVIPAGGRIFVHVYLEPADLPKAVMLQLHVDGWSHRAVWGDVNAIPFGEVNTEQRKSMGPLPKAGEWVRLEVPMEALKLKAGTKVTGLAFTQQGGTVYWDKAGVQSRVDPVTAEEESESAWLAKWQGKRHPEAPDDVRDILRTKKPEERTEEQKQRLHTYWLEKVSRAGRALVAELQAERSPMEQARKQLDEAIPATLMMKDMPTARDSFVMKRGQYDQPGEKVLRGTPAILPPLKKDSGNGAADYNRLDLARWLMSPEHPLTARVAVNRLWQQFFGIGLVKTSADFGSQGEPPSHPELLDWLAVTYRESGWDTKAFVRMLVTSQTYRQSSRVTPELLARDPENRLLARGPRFRLDAEQLRDNALFVSGLLDPTMGGKGVKPYQPENIWEPVGFGGSNTRNYMQDKGSALYRRTLYTFLKRTAPPPSMTTFDAPNREQSCTRRERSNTPLQALQLMNDVQHFEAARQFAQRMIKEGGRAGWERLAWGWRVATSRLPTDDEMAVVQDTLKLHLDRYRSSPDAAKLVISAGESKPDPALDPGELAAYTMVANLLLNLDETLTRN